MKRILITGAAGFLGSHLCDRFIAEGYYVIGMDNLITGDLKNIEHLFKLKEFEFYHHDVSKFVHVPGRIDYIFHTKNLHSGNFEIQHEVYSDHRAITCKIWK